MATRPTEIAGEFELRRHRRQHDAMVASWVPTAQDLFMLAPGTMPPLTAEKVRGWAARRARPLSLWRTQGCEPVAYAELNGMPQDARDVWIGHLLVSPRLRGQGLGYSCMVHLLHWAFAHDRAKRVSLVVFPQNQPAVHCYLKSGFSVVGTEIRSFDSRPGRYKMLKMVTTRKQHLRRGPFLDDTNLPPVRI